MPKLLIVDDEPNLLYSLKKGLESDELRVLTAETAEQGVSGHSGTITAGRTDTDGFP